MFNCSVIRSFCWSKGVAIGASALLLTTAPALCGLGVITSAVAQTKGAPTIAPCKTIDINRYEAAIEQFEKRDAERPPSPDATLFVGSSTFTKWASLEADLAAVHAVNRGFGGATIGEINHFAPRYVTAFRPKRVVFYAGTNDIGELHHSGAMVAHDFEQFADFVEGKLPGTEIYFVSMSVAPSRLSFEKDFVEGNRLIADFCKHTAHMHYIDVTPVMRDSSGRLRGELFGFDRLHMNRAGYELWIPVLKEALKKRVVVGFERK